VIFHISVTGTLYSQFHKTMASVLAQRILSNSQTLHLFKTELICKLQSHVYLLTGNLELMLFESSADWVVRRTLTHMPVASPTSFQFEMETYMCQVFLTKIPFSFIYYTEARCAI
jgi:hypothetical protein